MKPFLAVCLALTLSAGPAAADATLDRLHDSGEIRIGYRIDAPPFAYRNRVGEPAGYSVRLCRAVAAALEEIVPLDSLDIEYVPVTAENRFEMVQNGEIDLLCGATTATLSRRELVDFSIPTFADGASVLLLQGGPRDFTELDGRRVGVRKGTTTEKALSRTVRELGIAIEEVAVPDHREGVARLLAGDIDSYFADRSILLYYMLGMRGNDAELLYLSERQFTYEPYALAMARGHGDFRLAVDRALSRIYRSSAIRDIFTATFGTNARPSEDVRALYRISALPD